MDHIDHLSSSESQAPHTSSDSKITNQSASSLYVTFAEEEAEAQEVLDSLEDLELKALATEYGKLGFFPTEILEEVRGQQAINSLEDLELKTLTEKFLDTGFPPTTALKLAQEIQE